MTPPVETYFWYTEEGWFVGTDSESIGPFLTFEQCIYRWHHWRGRWVK